MSHLSGNVVTVSTAFTALLTQVGVTAAQLKLQGGPPQLDSTTMTSDQFVQALEALADHVKSNKWRMDFS